MKGKVFMIGATGTIGSAVCESLKKDGYSVTALVHSRSNELDIDTVQGSITDTDLIKENLKGHEYLFIAINAGNDKDDIMKIERDAVIEVLKIAEAVGVKKVVYVSGMYAEKRFKDYPSEAAKVAIENYLKTSTLTYTIFRPGFIDVTLEQFVQGNKIMLLGRQPHPMHIIKLEDMAGDMVELLSNKETDNKVFVVTGRETPILLKDALIEHGNTFTPPLPVRVMPLLFMTILNKTVLRGKLTRALDTMKLMKAYGEIGDSAEYHEMFSRQRS